MRTRRTGGALIVSLFLLHGCGGGSGSGNGSAQGRIVFQKQGDIWTMNADGSSQQKLTLNGINPVWSPDGRRIAFRTFPTNNTDAIWIMNADGSSRNQLTTTDTPEFYHVAWSPDGKQIAFVSGGSIWQVGVNGIGQHKLIDNAFLPSWSPDGRKFAFVSGTDRSLFTTTFDGTSPQQLTTFPVYDYSWSPDGTKIAYDRDVNLRVMNADGSNGQNLTNDPSRMKTADDPYFDPSWSPDGSKIVFTADHQPIGRPPGVSYLWVMNADGSNIQQLPNTAFSSQANWDPAR